MDDYDRERIVKGADDFLDDTRTEWEGCEGLALDHVMIIGIVTYTDEDGDAQEGLNYWASTARLYAQMGILRSALTALENRMNGGNDGDE